MTRDLVSASPVQHVASSSSGQHDTPALPHGLQSLPQLAQDTPAASARASESEKHPKGKRKRTAAKDKMILEEAYKTNPKPDKHARLQIVDRVSLNEKEVQIWFQNRRQNDRRKSRPLSPEELAALRYGGMHGVSSDSGTSRGAIADADRCCPASDPAGSRGADQAPRSPRVYHASPEQSQSLADTTTPGHEASARSHSESTPPQSQEAPSSQRPSREDSEPLAHSFSSSVGYLANRWNLGSSFSTPSALSSGGEGAAKLEPVPPSSCSSDTTHNANKSQSHVRLSLSLEGKAELVTNQPSPLRDVPPRPSSTIPSLPQSRRGGLQRSHSALPSITLPPISALTNSLPPRLVRGRSRDVHAWESCADAERRDELTAQAEHESNGSAIAAISLLRSSCGVLQPNVTKRNSSIPRSQQSRQAKKAKFSRTSSTYARLENVGAELEKPRESVNGKVKVAMLISPTDSDKENWSPDEDEVPRGNPRRRPLPAGPPSKSQNPRRVLQDHKGTALLGSWANAAPGRAHGAAKDTVEIFEDPDRRPPSSCDDEVERFMRGEVSPSKKGDMDCVAGLLSLSQGAWR